MKGIVFTEFLEMVESQLGIGMVDRIITAAELPHDGAYTSVGTYHHGEMVRLLVALSAASAIPVPDLLQQFGTHLFRRFTVMFPSLFDGISGVFEFLRAIDGYIHVEVRKLYPDAELPHFRCEDAAPGELVLIYSSPRGLGDLAEGLIRGCIAYYDEPLQLQRTDLPASQGEHHVRFHLLRLGG
jgi:hypothetical protein